MRPASTISARSSGYYSNAGSVQHSFLYSAGAYITLDDPLLVSGINNSGVLVGELQTATASSPFPGRTHRRPPAPAPTWSCARDASAVAGLYQIYDIGNNAILAAYSLGQVGTDWAFVTLGGFNDGDTSDMLLRNSTTGGFQVYDISNNNITGSAFLGNVGLNWQVMGFGNFSSRGENDMILRNSGAGGMQVYDISNNQITGSAFLGTVGLNWQMAGVSNHGTQSDLVLRDSGTGGLRSTTSTTIRSPALRSWAPSDWIGRRRASAISAAATKATCCCATSTPAGSMLYDIANNQITGAFFLGTVGLDWQFAGVAPVHAPGASDLVLRNVNTGAFQVYNIANNQLTGSASLGAVGLDWQLGGFAANCAGRRIHGQLRHFNLSTRPGDGRLCRRQRRAATDRMPASMPTRHSSRS